VRQIEAAAAAEKDFSIIKKWRVMSGESNLRAERRITNAKRQNYCKERSNLILEL
jgi:hypothetical protein